MCGIAGYVMGLDGRPKRELLVGMCNAIRHRGPDSSGYFLDDGVALGHRRLSIIDVSGGDQPIGNEDGSIQIVFNGEIYNYRELREGLLQKGHVFATDSDTEVIVHLYEEAGEKTPEYLNGMFAFAIWDARSRALFLARDRVGKKPLYYTSGVPGLRLCFASELKALLTLPGFSRRVNTQAVADYLTFSYVPDPSAIFQGVMKLGPAHSLMVTPSGQRLRRYWSPTLNPKPQRRFAESVEHIQALAADAVERRMISDVPLGAFLSGGVDSSAVVGFMARASDKVTTFSIGFTEKRFDELEFANAVVKMHRTDHHERVVSPSVTSVLATLINHFDEPFGDSSAIPTLYLAQMTRQYVTVALSGDGADEVFAGYRRYYHCLNDARLRSLFPEWFRRSVFGAAARHYPALDQFPRPFRAKSALARLSETLADTYFRWMSPFHDIQLEDCLSDYMRKELSGYSPKCGLRARFTALSHLPALLQMQAVDLETYLPGDILVKIDRATMAHSLEARCPWLDYRLIEAANQLPPHFKLQGAISKRVFREACAPLLPRVVLERQKMGFAVPLSSWMRTSLKTIFETAVFRPEMEAYFCVPRVQRLWEQHQCGVKDHASKLWNILILALWDTVYVQQQDISFDETGAVAYGPIGN